jgi:hypothetical protein
MAKKIARVSDQWLVDPRHPEAEIRVDSAAWFQWLEDAANISFSYGLFDPRCGYIVGFMTVRKERKQRGYYYWSAYRRRNGRLHKRYVGPSRQVTQARLDAIADTFQQEGAAQRAAAEIAPQAEEPLQCPEEGSSSQPPPVAEPSRAQVFDVASKEPRNMDNAVRSATSGGA